MSALGDTVQTSHTPLRPSLAGTARPRWLKSSMTGMSPGATTGAPHAWLAPPLPAVPAPAPLGGEPAVLVVPPVDLPPAGIPPVSGDSPALPAAETPAPPEPARPFGACPACA